MGETDTDAARRVPENTPVAVNSLVLHKSKLPFTISLASFIALLLLIFAPALISVFTGKEVNLRFDLGPNTSPLMLLLALYLPHALLFITTITSGYIGYKLVVASGANPESPIPPNNYALLAPLIRDGKSQSIDQYVRLSSLRGFTGTFTKLGLTGLPLTTVTLTLIFAILALLPLDTESQRSFFDLTKLTLGAFIGSFVQRQVEQRQASESQGDEPQTPPLSG
jgi:hypothetical protein